MASPKSATKPPRPPQPPASDIVLDRLTRLHPKIIDLSLGRVERLLARLDHPERRIAPAVHVAGTNGKGSVIAFLAAMLRGAGKRAQVYTSPHLVRFHERIRLAGGPIGEADLVELLEACEAANGPDPITFFEITTVAAFLAFAREEADIVLLETGLGGRLDATNVIARPRLTAITPISIDHVQYLGETIEQIAFEKAGILKPGVPAVIGPQPPAALAVIARRAAEVGAPLYCAGRDWHARAEAGGLLYEGEAGIERYPAPLLSGGFQIVNAGLALACAERLGDVGLDARARASGLTHVEWPARLQRLAGGRLDRLLPAGWEMWLDGGHNAAAGEALSEVARAWSDRPLHLVYGMLNTKPARDFVRPLAPLARSLHAVAIPGVEASLSAGQAAAEAAETGIEARIAMGVEDAIRAIVAGAPGASPGRILICGSLYLAGHVLATQAARG